MRVIAGEFRGTPLTAPAGDTTRPITDRAKETIFNVLGHRFGLPGYLPDFEVLDLFAGSGGLGIECLSRGARSCTFIERDRTALAALRGNIARLRLEPRTRVQRENIWTMRIPRSAAEDGFGLVFVDPPYRDSNDAQSVLDLLERLAPRLSAGGLVVFRQGIAGELPVDRLVALRVCDERIIGTMRVTLLEHRAAADARSPDAALPGPV